MPFLLQMKSNSNDIKKETHKRGRWSKTKGTSSLDRPLKLNRQKLSPFQNNPEYLLVWDFLFLYAMCVSLSFLSSLASAWLTGRHLLYQLDFLQHESISNMPHSMKDWAQICSSFFPLPQEFINLKQRLTMWEFQTQWKGDHFPRKTPERDHNFSKK